MFRASLEAPGGRPAHAASSIRNRGIYLERALQDDPAELARVLIHELFHFVWVRLSNQARWSWEAVLQAEHRSRARGELGYSAEWRKQELNGRDVASRNRRWREYACESFCDSAAWYYSATDSPEHTLARQWTCRRADWLRNRFPTGERISL